MMYGTTLFDNGVNGPALPSGQWIPLSKKKGVEVGDRVLSHRDTPGIIVEMCLVRDSDDNLTIGCVIYFYNNSKRLEDRIGRVAIAECDWIKVEVSA